MQENDKTFLRVHWEQYGAAPGDSASVMTEIGGTLALYSLPLCDVTVLDEQYYTTKSPPVSTDDISADLINGTYESPTDSVR